MAQMTFRSDFARQIRRAAGYLLRTVIVCAAVPVLAQNAPPGAGTPPRARPMDMTIPAPVQPPAHQDAEQPPQTPTAVQTDAPNGAPDAQSVTLSQQATVSQTAGSQTANSETATSQTAPAPPAPRRGPVTNLPLPRYVTLKTSEGNVRRGPSVNHRIDWVFARPGMPLRVTAEHENWRRVEDAEGAGGWVHFSLLSGNRSVLVRTDMAELRNSAQPDGTLIAKLESGVVARLLACTADQCRVQVDGWRGWLPKPFLWGVDPDEVME